MTAANQLIVEISVVQGLSKSMRNAQVISTSSYIFKYIAIILIIFSDYKYFPHGTGLATLKYLPE